MSNFFKLQSPLASVRTHLVTLSRLFMHLEFLKNTNLLKKPLQIYKNNKKPLV